MTGKNNYLQRKAAHGWEVERPDFSVLLSDPMIENYSPTVSANSDAPFTVALFAYVNKVRRNGICDKKKTLTINIP